MAINDVYRLTVRYRYALQQCQQSLYFQMKTSPDPTLALAQALADDWKEVFRANQNATCLWDTWELRQVRGADVIYDTNLCQRTGGQLHDGFLTGTLAGAGAGDGMPPQCAIVITTLTGLAGRSRRGRIYLGGLGETDQVSGTVNAATVTSMTTAYNAQITQYGSAGTDANFQWVVWSDTIAFGCRVNPNPPPSRVRHALPSPGTAAALVTGFKVRSTIFTQRRRTIGRGA